MECTGVPGALGDPAKMDASRGGWRVCVGFSVTGIAGDVSLEGGAGRWTQRERKKRATRSAEGGALGLEGRTRRSSDLIDASRPLSRSASVGATTPIAAHRRSRRRYSGPSRMSAACPRTEAARAASNSNPLSRTPQRAYIAAVTYTITVMQSTQVYRWPCLRATVPIVRRQSLSEPIAPRARPTVRSETPRAAAHAAFCGHRHHHRPARVPTACHPRTLSERLRGVSRIFSAAACYAFLLSGMTPAATLSAFFWLFFAIA